MSRIVASVLSVAFIVSALTTTAADEGAIVGSPSYQEISGSIAIEGRLFARPPLYEGQKRHSASVVAEPEYYAEWDDQTSLTVAPFVRVDSADPERTHVDVRELYLRLVGDDWELGGGVGKVFWGVTESRHLIDIVNQTDLIENIDEEDKLGQPMLNLTLIRDWGYVDLFYLPYFRERTFQGRRGRLRNQLVIDTDQTRYTSGVEEWHPDFAARYSNSFGNWDLGIAHFYGTSREPSFSIGLTSGGAPTLIPEYELINQTSTDIQYTTGAWLWKFEGYYRQGQKNRRGDEENFYAMVGGFEYTLFGLFDSDIDFGILTEYLRDSRLRRASTALQNDIFIGGRIALNDAQDTQLLAGVIQDLRETTRLYFVEANRRFGDSWRATLELRSFTSVDNSDILFSIRDDDFVQLELAYFY